MSAADVRAQIGYDMAKRRINAEIASTLATYAEQVPAAPPAGLQAGQLCTTTAHFLNLRATEGRTGRELAQLRRGTRLRVTALGAAGWVRVDVLHQSRPLSGWVSSAWLVPEAEDAPWVVVAKLEERRNVRESHGAFHNARIVLYHAMTGMRATDDETPWCASFACWCLEEAGIPSPRSARARDFLAWGRAIEDPVPGCIVVLDRGDGRGHVGFYVGGDEHVVYLLGGNQSDRVCVAAYERRRVHGYRMPPAEG